jgi:hypothetical protein
MQYNRVRYEEQQRWLAVGNCICWFIDMFILGAYTILKSKTKNKNYHDKMISENFSEGVRPMLVWPNCLTVLDNAPYRYA